MILCSSMLSFRIADSISITELMPGFSSAGAVGGNVAAPRRGKYETVNWGAEADAHAGDSNGRAERIGELIPAGL